MACFEEVLDTAEEASIQGRGTCDMLHTARTKDHPGVTIMAIDSYLGKALCMKDSNQAPSLLG